MFTSKLKSSFDECGFISLQQFLDPSELAELRSELDRYISEVVPSLPDTSAFYQDRSRPETLKQLQHMGDDYFSSIVNRCPKWSELACHLVGEPVLAHEPEWFNKPPGTDHPTPPHQDNYYFCLAPPRVVTLWVALDPADAENGALRYVRASHLRGLRPHGRSEVLGFSQGITDYGREDAQAEELMTLGPGDLIAHHGNTIHRADANSTTQHRRAFAIVFHGESCKRDEPAYARYLEALREQQVAMGLTSQ